MLVSHSHVARSESVPGSVPGTVRSFRFQASWGMSQLEVAQGPRCAGGLLEVAAGGFGQPGVPVRDRLHEQPLELVRQLLLYGVNQDARPLDGLRHVAPRKRHT